MSRWGVSSAQQLPIYGYLFQSVGPGAVGDCIWVEFFGEPELVRMGYRVPQPMSFVQQIVQCYRSSVVIRLYLVLLERRPFLYGPGWS